ncbi:MAG: type I-C CRISPR-associated protein Cas8c/Csd1 [Ruminococcus sp.]|nr:type I-C CRISPR-associated protein Cas8c/Csd1 [Ruminococcus sp.]
MSWISMLYQTYENNLDKIGKIDNVKEPLPPVAHMLANSQIEITIDEDGRFVDAKEVSKENSKTIIPCTEKSSGRASDIAPHPLCDTLSYVAGDYEDYVLNQKDKSKAHEKFESYIQGLSTWCDSDYAHPKACAILKYTRKCQTIYNLVQSGLIKLSDDGKFAKAKIQSTDYEKCIVRYRVTSSKDDSISSAVWEDKTLSNAFTKYYLSEQPKKRDVCFVSGKDDVISINPPKGIVAANYGAKLISANDSNGFTYRGRFLNSDEASTVSYEATQKSHSALRWLVANQGVSYGGRTFICWNPVGKEIPNPLFDFGAELHGDTALRFKDELYKAFKGFDDMLDSNDDIVIISLDAATTGRLSITLYNELKASTFLKNYKLWCNSVRWRIPDFTPEGKYIEPIHTLKTQKIVEYAFGDEQNGYVTVKNEVIKEHSQRLINCMINNQRFPYDIAHALACKASNPLAYTKLLNANRVLSYACAAIAKYHNQSNQKNEGVKYDMELDNNNSNRSYLFGRLLAIAEKVEGLAMYKSGSTETRETNAIRLRSAFANHPMHTWRILSESLDPYYEKLKPETRTKFRNLSNDLMNRIADVCTTEGELNKRLEDVYLIGYSNQYNEFKYKKDENQEDENQ